MAKNLITFYNIKFYRPDITQNNNTHRMVHIKELLTEFKSLIISAFHFHYPDHLDADNDLKYLG